MTADLLSRRSLAVRGGFLLAGASVVAPALAADNDSAPAAAGNGEIVHNACAIHQEVVFAATPQRVYRALTMGEQFDKVVQLSAAVRTQMAIGTAPTQIGTEPGSPFTLFGGYISGRQLELVPDALIVQAWHTASWDPAIYSIAKFALATRPDGTQLVFDHTGFPASEAEHLADGWHANYWEPLAKFLAA